MDADVERLSSRLAEVPVVFTGALHPRDPEGVHVDAVLADLFRERASRSLTPAELSGLFGNAKSPTSEQYLRLVLIASWLLHDPVFQWAPAQRLHELFAVRLSALSQVAVARVFIEEAERREELVRTSLAALGIVPAGETEAFAADRLALLDSVRQAELMREAKARADERQKRRAELERLRRQEEEDRRKAARTTFED